MQVNDADRRKLRDTIAALKAKTIGNGCTEAEALAAAEKVAELLSKHGVASESELEFEELAVEIGRRTVVDNLWSQVAIFCHCKLWYRGNGRRWAVIYFGRWNDVVVAEYLQGVMERHIRAATKAFQATPEYRRRRSPRTKREATKAFQEGLVAGLRDKLWAIQWRRVPKTEGTNHLALVLSPLAPVEAEMERRNIQFSGKPLAPVKGASKAFNNERWSGAAAARSIDISAAVGGGQQDRVAGCLT
ncbi:DUF2786 domain-containing protein [Telmatospirillum sp. J64-1]|uniref:DUF7168 domain-containing protein n=1 Tax=Telmatospirillum sp. J64-1 TaxID=2502183 RepID=UPI00115DF156|nr:DUF2786 domain-containing protein [Telmatospirillum sp. J64-1]